MSQYTNMWPAMQQTEGLVYPTIPVCPCLTVSAHESLRTLLLKIELGVFFSFQAFCCQITFLNNPIAPGLLCFNPPVPPFFFGFLHYFSPSLYLVSQQKPGPGGT